MHRIAIMDFTNLISFLFYVLISISLSSTGQECIHKGEFATNSTYGRNRDLILSSLASDVIVNRGFYTATMGEDPNKIYALALCRGDSSSEKCESSVNTAIKDILMNCPNQKEAISWGVDPPCIVRYANRPLYGKLELSPTRAGSNLESISSNATKFNQTWNGLMDRLVMKASKGSSELKFAAEEAKLTPSVIIYALMQCTPDISQTDCEVCLRKSVADFDDCCHGKKGGNLQRPSCIFRWETFPFYEDLKSQSSRPAPRIITPSPSPGIPPEFSNTKITKDHGNIASGFVAIIVVSAIIFVAFVAFITFAKLSRIKQKNAITNADKTEMESFQFAFSTIKAATSNFSDGCKLGQGGFGAVYKGKLPDGQDIAVKRLSRDSGQGEIEFKNEVLLLTKLQHRNLVKLLGFCLKGKEKLLIYEFVPNSSLDNFIFDSIKRPFVDWETRYKIIVGIARGILYLHEDSRLRIIHRDLKASNILLDINMNPKISDFGMAKLFEMDQTQGNTSRLVGTFGYMAPEYIKRGHFSVKSDVFGFGVLLLEIISGQQNSCFCNGEEAEDLLTYTWINWMEGTASSLIDPILRVAPNSEIMRCINIGLLCVQENLASRPTMASIVLMLTNSSVSLPMPLKPAYFMLTADSDQSRSDSVQTSVSEAPSII